MDEELAGKLRSFLYKQQLTQLQVMSCFIELTRNILDVDKRQSMTDKLQKLLEAMEEEKESLFVAIRALGGDVEDETTS